MEKAILNCWEFKNCGREPGGKNSALFGVCPVALEEEIDGIHGGKNAGRCCWLIASSYGSRGPFGCFGSEFTKCEECEFYKMVKEDTDLLVVA
ncbi:MAG: hypothetical protein D3908_03965 [Candidatus Electrothrix sp. AUS4]|nr:hypothetical protein [Candidatus Electrothrix sp. AUS4]